MRIVAGTFGGRRLKSVAGMRTRPTPEKVREALFAMLGERVQGARFLDLYAGTGAVGLEALSRGADHAVFVESERRPQAVLRGNIDALDVSDRCRVVGGRLPGVLATALSGESPFDYVFADPPYQTEEVSRLLASEHLLHLVAPCVRVIVEVDKRTRPQEGFWRLSAARSYGDTCLLFYEPKEDVST